MALDGIFTHFLVNELNEKLNKSRVESIWFNQSAFYFQFYKQKERMYLNINLNAAFSSAYITNNPAPKADSSNFTNLLKKNLEGSILDSVTQYDSDRVFIFTFTSYDFILGPIKKQVIFEAMGKHSNLFLIQDNKILDCYKRNFVLDGRNLMPNANFEFFKTDKMNAVDYIFTESDSAKDISSKYNGISLRLAKYLEKNNVHPYQIPLNPSLSIEDNKSYFFNIFETETTHFDSLSEAIDNKKLLLSNPKNIYTNFIVSMIKKLERKQEQLLREKTSSYNHLADKQVGDAIYQSGLDLNKSYQDFNGIPLDERYSLSKNAQIFYKNYHKAKRSLSFIENEINQTKDLTETFNNYLFEVENTPLNEITDFKEILTPYGFLKQNNKKAVKPTKHKINILTIKDPTATYYVGKNSLQNQYLVNEIGKPNDYWFHIKEASGSHVLVKTEKLDEPVLRKASMLAAKFSSLSMSSSIPVNYTLFKYVSKISGKPASFVKIKNEKTIFIDIDEKLLNSYIAKS